MNPRRAAELAARDSYGRLVAYLAARTRDIAAAEDALGEAFLSALQSWPETGVPSSPEAWLLVAARRQLIDAARRRQIQDRVLHAFESVFFSPSIEASLDAVEFSDDHLKLLFICAHPAIQSTMHTPLMLQVVLGLNAAQIGSAFLVAPTTMGQRLVRAKSKIRDASIPFEVPAVKDLPERLTAVLEAIYAAYTHGWEGVAGGDRRHRSLVEEAVWLARLCVQLMPQEPETWGLLALMLYCESRGAARRTASGAYVPLCQQDPRLWSPALIREAEQALTRASQSKRVGRFQLEAAIQSVHAQRAVTQQTDWSALGLLYEGLVQLSPTLGALVNQAAVIAHTRGLAYGLQHLDQLPVECIQNYQPYWAARAHILQQLGRNAEAQQAYAQAIGLAEDAAVRDFLLRQSSELTVREEPEP
ncbi:MAG: DUF6596 domain-containing protein [Cyanobacteria bacterium P01_H01_bin.153]